MLSIHPNCRSGPLNCQIVGVSFWDHLQRVGLTLDLKRRLMTPFERLSAVRSEVTQTDMLLLSLLARTESTSSAPPSTAKDRPPDGEKRQVRI